VVRGHWKKKGKKKDGKRGKKEDLLRGQMETVGQSHRWGEKGVNCLCKKFPKKIQPIRGPDQGEWGEKETSGKRNQSGGVGKGGRMEDPPVDKGRGTPKSPKKRCKGRGKTGVATTGQNP